MISVKTQVIEPVGAAGELCILWLQLELRLALGLEVGLELWLGGVKGGIGVISSDVLGAEVYFLLLWVQRKSCKQSQLKRIVNNGTTQ